MKRRNIILLSIISLFIILLIVVIILNLENGHTDKKTSKPLYIYNYENYSWGYYSDGYIIYDDGAIGKSNMTVNTDDIDKRPEQKITNEELKKLKNLADKVTDDYLSEEVLQGFDMGQSVCKVYNSILDKWIILNEGGSYVRINKSEISKEILEYTKMLENKYLKTE